MSTVTCTPGLQKANDLIKQPISLHRRTKDVVLTGITRSCLQVTSASYETRYCLGNGLY